MVAVIKTKASRRIFGLSDDKFDDKTMWWCASVYVGCQAHIIILLLTLQILFSCVVKKQQQKNSRSIFHQGCRPSVNWDRRGLWIHVSVGDNAVCLFCKMKWKSSLCSQEMFKNTHFPVSRHTWLFFTLHMMDSIFLSQAFTPPLCLCLSLSHTHAEWCWYHLTTHTRRPDSTQYTCFNTAAATKQGGNHGWHY